MAQGSFSAQISSWVSETKDRQERVYKESAKRIVAIMQTPRSQGGNLRFDTGYLRSSLTANTTGTLPPVTYKPDGVESFSYDAAAINLVISGADIKDPITIVYTSNYAVHREYGSSGHPGDRWVALAAQRWQAVVSEVCLEAQKRAGG